MIDEYWTFDDGDDLESAKNYEKLFDIALRVIKRMPQPVCQVCGPVTTGGLGSMDKNMEEIEKMIRILRSRGISVFNNMVFEEAMQRIKKTPYYRGGNHLLNAFYLPLFESGLVKVLCFLPGWTSSEGAKWEHEQALRLGIKIVYL